MTNPRKGSRAINPPADSPLNPRFDEGGMNFQTGGKFQRWALWSVILLTLPQFLSWFAAQGISMPPQGGNISSQWVASVETSLTGLVSNVIVATLVPILAAFCVLKAALDDAGSRWRCEIPA